MTINIYNQKETLNIPGTDFYKLTKNGLVINENNEVLPVVNNSVVLPLYGRVYTINMNWLKKYVKYQLYLPEMFYDRVLDIDFKPYSLRSHGVDWDDMVIHKRPMEFKLNTKLYRLVPVYPFLAVSEDGEIINVYKHNIKPYTSSLKSTDIKDSYKTITFRFPNTWKCKTKFKTVRVHRLVAMAWVPNDDYFKKPIVDHKDGNKQNCHASNLEWVSFSENNKRAAASGLRTDNIDVKVMDYETGKIYIFGSMTEACKFMGRSRINRVEEFCSEPKLVNGRYQVKLLNDMSDWDFKDLKGEFKVTIKGETKHYKTLKDVKTELTPNLSEKKGKDDVIRTLKKLYPDIVIDFPESNKLNVNTYQVLDVKSGKIYECKTRKDIEKLTGLSKSTIAKYIKLGPGHAYKGFSIRVKSDEPWSDIKHHNSDISIKLLVENQFTGEVTECDSYRKAAAIVGVDRKTIKRMIDTGLCIKGYKIY